MRKLGTDVANYGSPLVKKPAKWPRQEGIWAIKGVAQRFNCAVFPALAIDFFELCDITPYMGYRITKVWEGAKMSSRGRYSVLVETFFFVAVLASTSFGDTFVNRATGETFNGYVVKIYRGDKIQVRTDGGAKYVDLGMYDVQRNSLGRKKQVPVFAIKDPVELLLQAEAFEKAITSAANQGPLFILIEIDTISSRRDVAQRIADAIIATDTCGVYALLTGERIGGAFDTAVVFALACDRIYATGGASIGALKTPAIAARVSPDLDAALAAPAEEMSDADWFSYVGSVARRKNHPETLAKAMFDENVELVEVSVDNQIQAVDRLEVRAEMKIVGTISDVSERLTLGARQAARFGLVDGIAASRAELLISLGASNARQIPKNVILRSRVAFDRDMRRINPLLETIAARKEREAEINAGLKEIEELLKSLGQDLTYGIYSYSTADAERLYAVNQRRQALLLETLDLLSAQVADYQAAIRQTTEWADLDELTETLQQQLQTDAAKLNDTRLKARLF